MPWCWNITRPNIYYLHSINTQHCLFSWGEEGALRCAGHAGRLTAEQVNSHIRTHIMYNSTQIYFIQLLKIHFQTATYTVFFFFCSRSPGISCLCEQEQMSSTSSIQIKDTGLNWKERDRCWCRWRGRCAVCQILAWTGHVINTAALH